MDRDCFLYRVPVDQLINLLQKIPFTGVMGYIIVWEIQITNDMDLKSNYIISHELGFQLRKDLTEYAA